MMIKKAFEKTKIDNKQPIRRSIESIHVTCWKIKWNCIKKQVFPTLIASTIFPETKDLRFSK